MRIFFSLFFLSSTLNAQQWLGVSTSNYAGTYNIYSNPANVADSRYKFFMNVVGGNAEFINNYASWAAPYSFIGMATNTVSDSYRASNGLVGFKPSYIVEARNKPNTTAFAAADIKGPSMIYTFEKAKFAIGLTSRVRVLNNLANTTSDVAHIMVQGTVVPDLYGVLQQNNHFTMNLNGYSEMGMTLGLVVKEQDQNYLKVGFTVKRVNGVLNLHYLVNEVDFRIDQNAARPKRQDLFFQNIEGTYGTTTSAAFQTAGFTPNWLFGNQAAATGYGFDIGAVYEFRPDFDKYDMKIKGKWQTDGTKNKYLYKISVALIDVGKLNYNNPNLVNQIKVSETNVLIPPGTFNKIDSPDRLFKQTNAAFGLQETDYTHSFVSQLPMAFSANFDYKLTEKLYFNTTLVQSLTNQNRIGSSQPSIFAFIPRYESKWFDLAMPLALINGYRNFTVGLGGRVGPLFLGTDNLAGILNIGNPKGINAYFGLTIPLFRKLPDAPNGCYIEEKSSLRQELRKVIFKRKQRQRWNKIR
jgi:hypothetical protein